MLTLVLINMVRLMKFSYTNSTSYPTTYFASSEIVSGNDTQTLNEIRDLVSEQTSYIGFFVIVSLGGVIIYKFLNLFRIFF